MGGPCVQVVWSGSLASRSRWGRGLSGEGSPAFPPLSSVQQTNPNCGQFVSGATAQGLHRDERDTVLVADRRWPCTWAARRVGEWRASDASRPTVTTTSSTSRYSLLCSNRRTCSETSNNTARAWSLCLTSVMSSCMTLMPVPTRPSATPSSRPPEAWTDAGGTSAPCRWNGE